MSSIWVRALSSSCVLETPRTRIPQHVNVSSVRIDIVPGSRSHHDFPSITWLLTGPLYYVYMSLLSTFTTNSINILAGVNGVEVGQTLIIALSVLLNDLLYLPLPQINLPIVGQIWEHDGMSLLGVIGGEEMVRRHLLSAYFMGPLVGVCTGLLYHNWYVAFSDLVQNWFQTSWMPCLLKRLTSRPL